MHTMGFLSMPGQWEWLILLALGLLLFGKRLPEVGRSLGAGIVEFKRGLKGISDDIETESGKAGEAKKFESARPPVDASGQDQRVSRADPLPSEAKPATEG